MRALKFRVWDDREKRYVTQDENNPYGYVLLDMSGHITIVGEEDDGGRCDVEVDMVGHLHAEMSTGVTDRNGVEIYEGDVVTACIYHKDERRLPVRWYGGSFIIDYVDGDGDFFDCGSFPGWLEVIGNVHENLELLEEK